MSSFITGMILGVFIPVGIILISKKAYRYYCSVGDYVYFFVDDTKVIGKIVDFYADNAIILGMHGKKYSVRKKEIYEI